MADAYLAISEIANDEHMTERLRACATQETHLNNSTFIVDPISWVYENRYVWAASPEWGAKWESAKVTHVDDEGYEPGRDAAVITDGDILATVQHLTGPPSE